MMEPYYMILCLLISACGVVVSMDTAIGFIVEDSHNSYRIVDAGIPESKGVSAKVVLYPSGSKTLLNQAAKHVKTLDVDVVVALGGFNSVHQLHRVFGRGDQQLHAGSQFTSITDMYWYLTSLQASGNSSCYRQPEVVLAANCATPTATAQALASIVRQLKWNQLTLLYYPIYEELSTIAINMLSQNGVGVYQYRVSDASTISDIIVQTHRAISNESMNYILMADQAFAEATLEALYSHDKEAGGRSSITSFSPWIFWGEMLDLCKLAEKLGNLNNIAVVKSVPCGRQQYLSVRKELMPGMVINNAMGAVDRTDFNTTCSTTHRNEQNSVSYRMFLALQETLSCGNCLTDPKISVYSALWKTNGRMFDLVVDSVPMSKLRISNSLIFPNSEFGLNNVSLIITTLEWPPYVFKSIVGGKPVFTGFCVDLIDELAHKLNFSYTITEPADGEWGRILDGKWTGLVGQMQRQEADLTVAALSVQPEREEVMDFISPYYTEYTVIILKKPDENSYKWRTLVDPFHWGVLLTIALSLPTVTLFLNLCERLSPVYWGIKNRHKYPGLYHYKECFWYLLGALLTQGGVYLPKCQSSRTIISFWWLFSIIVVATYSGNLIASLTVTRDFVPFNSVQEMVQQSTYKWGTTNGTYLNMLLQISKDPIYRQLWAGIKRFEVDDPDVLNVNHTLQVEKVKAGQYAYLNDASSMNSEILTDCSLALVDEQFLPLHFAVGLRQDSIYRSIFDEQMLAISESGLLQVWKRKWWLRNSTCVGLLIRQAKPISLLDVQSAYYLLSIGILVAGLTVGLEYIKKFLWNREF